MRKMSFNMMILCFVAQSLSASPDSRVSTWGDFEGVLLSEKIASYRKEFRDEAKERLGYPETELAYARELFKNAANQQAFLDEKIASLREDFKDVEKLKKFFEGFLVYWLPCGDFPEIFQSNFGISDEVMRDVLMGMIRESAAKTGWKDETFKSGDTDEIWLARFLPRVAIPWLRLCVDAETKQFLMDIALDNTKAESYRREAKDAYLRNADEQEKKEFLARLEAGQSPPKEGGAQVSPPSRDPEAGRGVSHTPETPETPANIVVNDTPTQPEPVTDKTTPWKLPLLAGTLILASIFMAWRCFRKRDKA